MLDTKHLTSEFNKAVRSLPDFKGWMKAGARRHLSIELNISRAIELELFTGSSARRQNVGLSLQIGVPSNVEAVPLDPAVFSRDGYVYASAHVSPTQGLGSPTLGSDRNWWLANSDDLEVFIRNLPVLVAMYIRPTLDNIQNGTAALRWARAVHEFPCLLPMIFAVQGRAAARSEMRAWLASCPHSRPLDRFVNWAEHSGVISPQEAAGIKSATMQAYDTYRDRISAIAQQLAPHNISDPN